LPELTYERLIWDDSSLGFSVGYVGSLSSQTDVIVTPYHRVYFGNRVRGKMIFETNMAGLFHFEDQSYGFGLGAAIGYKHVTTNNWVVEVFLGGGRIFIEDRGTSNFSVVENYFRPGVLLGKRF